MMATWFDSSIDLTTEIAFASGPWDTTPTWTDVSAYVRNIETNRGSTSETAVFSPGSLRITFSNGDRRFDPDYSSSPYSPNIVPMKRVRVTATRSAVTFTLFLGWVTGWQQGWGFTDGVAYADCVDGGYFVQSDELAGSAYGAEVLADSPAHYWPMQTPYISNVVDTSNPLGTVSDLVEFAEVGFPLGEPLALLADKEDRVSLYTATPATGVVAADFWLRADSTAEVILSFGWIRLEYSLSSGWDLVYKASSTTGSGGGGGVIAVPGMPDIVHSEMVHVAITNDATDMFILVNGQVIFQEPLDSAPSVLSGVSLSLASTDGAAAASRVWLSHVALYTSTVTTDRMLDHYLAGLTAYGHPYGEREGERITRCLDEIGYPSNLRDISPGTVVVGPHLPAGRTAMEYVGDCVSAGQGLLFFDVDGKLTYRDRRWQWTDADSDGVVFSDDGSDVSYIEGSPNSGTVLTVRNIVTVSYSDVGAITNRDQTSIDDHGPSREFIDAPLIPNGTTASNLGKYVLRIKKDPKSTIPELLVKMRANVAGHFAPVLGLEIGEVVTVERTPMGVPPQVVRRHQVTGVSHRITPDNWETRFYLSPAVPMYDEAPYFTLGDATYGQLGATAGNLIPG